MREALLIMVSMVIVVDTIFIGAYYAFHLDRAAPRLRLAFTAVWTLASAVAVAIGLFRIRQARLAVRRRRPPT